MPICPDCYLELTPETESCPDCGVKPVAVEELALELEWPHCANCDSPAAEGGTRCSECGQSFYLVPFFPKVTAFLAAVVTFYLFAFILDKMGLTTNTMKILGVIAAFIVWYLLKQRTNLVLKTAPVPWSSLPGRTRDALRQSRK